MSGTVEKIKAKVENVLHKDKDTTHGTTGTHTTGTHTTGTHTTGTHTGTHGTTGGLGHNTHTTGSDPTGPHDSHMVNKLDPRVDSDQLGSYGNSAGARHTGTGIGSTGHTSGLTGSSNTYGSDPTGPHDSHLANKVDPRVDSSHAGSYGNTGSTGHTGGLTGSSNTYGSDPTGPHDSRLANKMDPRVDSSTAGSYGNTGSTGIGSTGHTGGLTGSSNTYGSDPTGPHDSHLANKADPRVDSSHAGAYGNTGHTGAGTHAGIGGGPGPAANTAGPHKSDMLNKVDPRVDSDLDGSKTYGGNKTSGY